MSPILTQADAAEKQQQQLAERRAEVATLPPRPDDDLERARAQQQRLVELSEASPWLTQLANHRRAIRAAQQPLTEQRELIETAKNELATITSEIETAQRDCSAADKAASAAQKEDAAADAEMKHARAALRALDNAQRQAACPTCGHDLTSDHLAEEQSRRREVERRAIAARAAAAKALQAASETLDRLRRHRTVLGKTSSAKIWRASTGTIICSANCWAARGCNAISFAKLSARS